MWFLIKGAFWFSLVLVLLPIFGTQDPSAPGTAPPVDVGDTVSAASEALGYLGAICMEKPDVCVKGAETFTALGHRAREGALIAYRMLDTQFGEGGDPVTTGTVTTKAGAPAQPLPTTPAAASSRPVADEAFAPSRIPVPEWRVAPPHRHPS